MVEIEPELFWSESELVEFVGLPCPIIALLEECSVIIVIEVVELEPGLEVSELICNQRKNKKTLVVSWVINAFQFSELVPSTQNDVFTP